MKKVLPCACILLFSLACPSFAGDGPGETQHYAIDTYGQTVAVSSLQMAAANSALDTYGQPVPAPAPSGPVDSYGQNPHATLQKPDRPRSISAGEFWKSDPFFKQNLDPRHVHTLQAGIEPYYSYYKEPDVSVVNRGMMLGYYVNYAYRPPEGNVLNNAVLNMYRVEGRYATGDLDYKGSGVVNNKRNENFEVRGIVGKDYLLTGNTLVTPYMGFGYRYLLDEGNGRLSSAGFYGYDRHSNYWYAPVGLTFNIPAGAWSTELNMEYDIFIRGLQVSDLSASSIFNPGVSNPNLHNAQTKGYGVRGSVKLMYSAPRFNFYVEPFVRYWSIDQSKVVTATVDGSVGDFVEPQNSTFEAGSKVGIQF